MVPGSVTLFGEMHGTDAGPAMVGRLLCRAATDPASRGVVLALEIPRGDQAQLDAALAAGDAATARAQLVAAQHFVDEWQDGRDTEAIVALVEHARTLRAAGLAVELLAFDCDPTVRDAGERDRLMGERLAESIAAHAGATYLVLSGNVHSRTKPGVPWDPAFVPMGAHLVQKVPSLRALNIATAGGTSWMCVSVAPSENAAAGTPPQCGEHPLRGEERGAEPFIELADAPDETGHHGIWYVGTTRASPPAVKRPT